MTRIKVNYSEENLFCTYSKERIHIGEKYVEHYEDYGGDKIPKPYKLDYAPTDEDTEEPYILEEE